MHADHRREIAIAAALHGDPKCENQSPLQEKGARMHVTILGSHREGGEVLFLDILSHRMSVMAVPEHYGPAFICPERRLGRR